jgi:hypothetical protein
MSSKTDHTDIEKLKLVVTIWQQSIDATKHFTDVSERTRRMGMTAAVGGIALAATLLTQFSSAKLTFIYDGYEYGIHAAGPIVFASALVVYVTKLLDVGLYHRMTRGSVAFTQAIEQSPQFKTIIDTPRGLAGSISFHSRAKRAITDEDANPAKPTRKTTAEYKLRRFYNLSILALIIIGLLLLASTLIQAKHENVEIIKQTITRPKK